MLALHLTSYEATTFLVGEYLEHETNSNPIFTVADGIVWLYQSTLRNSVVRRLQVIKMRGQQQIPGFHTVRLSKEGVRIFPRLPNPEEQRAPDVSMKTIKRTGIDGLDEMLGGGIPAGYSLLLAGPSGSGKTMLSTQFIVEGIKHGETGSSPFRETPRGLFEDQPAGRKSKSWCARRSSSSFTSARSTSRSTKRWSGPCGERIGAKRVVIDSLSGFELALAPTFREDFRESLYRMIGALTGSASP